MGAVRVLAPVDVASAVCELRVYRFQILGRIEVGFLEMVEQTLCIVSIAIDVYATLTH